MVVCLNCSKETTECECETKDRSSCKMNSDKEHERLQKEIQTLKTKLDEMSSMFDTIDEIL